MHLNALRYGGNVDCVALPRKWFVNADFYLFNLYLGVFGSS